MKLVEKDKAQRFKIGANCVAFEYPMDESGINGAVIEMTGRYPDKGLAMNEICKEMVYVMEGNGKVVVSGAETILQKGDLILIEPGEKFYWEGKMSLFMPCVPAWSPEQYKIFE